MRLSTPKSIRPDIFGAKRNMTSFGLRNDNCSKTTKNGTLVENIGQIMNGSTMMETRSLSSGDPEDVGNFYNDYTTNVKK